MGLASVYGFLESATVKQGEFVQAGQTIGQAGISGLGNGQQLLLEMRLNGQQIDPTEWWDQRWFQANITKPINRVRRLMGLPIRARVN
jgi:murein DD-endopeptidase MepM/ murein hydrolase activator NlpD